MTNRSIPEDLSIPAFLQTTSAGTPCTFEPTACSNGPNTNGAWPFAVRRDNCTPADIAAMHEIADNRAERDAVRDYHDQARLAELAQRAADNPELAAMERKAKRDAARRIARMGIPPAKRRSR